MAGTTADDRDLSALMVEYQNGDVDAFEGLYRALASPLQRYLASIVRNWATAEELVQETFLQIHRARHTYQPGRPVKPWIYAIGRNVALMHLRSKRRRGKHETLAPEELPDFPIPASMETFADESLIRRAVAELSDQQREALLLHHFLGLSFKEVGSMLGISTTAAKVRSHRAVKALRALLGADGEEGR